MDLFNKKKLAEKQKEIQKLNEEIEILESKLRGDNICDGYCAACKNSIVNEFFNPYFMGQRSKQYFCKLDVKCKNFTARE